MEIEIALRPPLMADGCVPSGVKILEYRGKMPLPLIIMETNLITHTVYN
jgi:hypothetical protein